MKKILFLLCSCILFSNSYADCLEQSTNKYFNSIKNNPKKLHLFLTKMPKGADLHYHLDGGSYAENLFQYALKSKKCIKPSSGQAENCTSKSDTPFTDIKQKSVNYNEIISDWSVVGNNITKNNIRFYRYFPKTLSIRENNRGEILSEIVKRASLQNIIYLELMLNPDEDQIRAFGMKQTVSASNFKKFTMALIDNGIEKYVNKLHSYMDSINKIKNHILKCGISKNNSSPCGVKVKYIYQVNRDVNIKAFFSAALEGFLIATEDKKFVGISLVGNESGKFSTKNYKEEMRIIAFLHKKYPIVKIELHAGELSKNIPSDIPYIGSHIRDAVDIANPNRIGHGTDIIYEKNFQSTLKKMREHQIAVEVCLTSNHRLLGITGNESQILTYYHNNVPITLCTDDEGILRTNLTHQYELAGTKYNFTYSQLKNIARNSIYYSFLPGKSLWESNQYIAVKKICRVDYSKKRLETTGCKNYLYKNEKARMEWKLERRFYQFEKSIKDT